MIITEIPTYLLLNQRGQGKEIEKIREVLPDVGVAVFTKTLIVETVNLCNLSRLVVTTSNSHAIRITNLESEEQGHGLNRVVTTIDVITHEKIVCLRGLATNSEELNKIVELTVNITADSDRAIDILDVILFTENFTGLDSSK